MCVRVEVKGKPLLVLANQVKSDGATIVVITKQHPQTTWEAAFIPKSSPFLDHQYSYRQQIALCKVIYMEVIDEAFVPHIVWEHTTHRVPPVSESVLSETLLMLCRQAEQPFGRGLNFLLGNAGA